MKSCSPRLQWAVWGSLSAVIVGILVGYLRFELGVGEKPLPVLWSLPQFSLTNQAGRVVSLDSLKGRVWLADIVFTRCPGPCVRLTRQMQEVQAGLRDRQNDTAFVSLTADPAFDTPAVLQAYAAKVNVDPANWNFLTADKPTLYDAALSGFKFALLENDPKQVASNADLFIHSTRFVVVDRAGRARKFVDGDEPGSVKEAIQVMRQLLRERTP